MDLYGPRLLAARSLKGRTQLKIQPLERLARDEPSSLLRKFVTYDRKIFYKDVRMNIRSFVNNVPLFVSF